MEIRRVLKITVSYGIIGPSKKHLEKIKLQLHNCIEGSARGVIAEEDVF